MERTEIFGLLDLARRRQQAKHGNQTPANPMMDPHWKLTVLVEEVGEVARALQDSQDDPDHLAAELIDVAAVALAWLESIELPAGKEKRYGFQPKLEGK